MLAAPPHLVGRQAKQAAQLVAALLQAAQFGGGGITVLGRGALGTRCATGEGGSEDGGAICMRSQATHQPLRTSKLIRLGDTAGEETRSRVLPSPSLGPADGGCGGGSGQG